MLVSGLRIKWIMAIILLPVIGLGQIKVSQLTDSSSLVNKEGLIYNLPRTRLIFDITLSKTSKEKGPFFEYAKDFLGIENVISRNSVEYKISDIHIVTLSEPDPGCYYFVERTRCFPWVWNKSIFLQTTSEGFLSSYNQFIKPPVSPEAKPKDQYYGLNQLNNNEAADVLPLYHINDALISIQEAKPKVDSTIRLPLRRPVYRMETKEMPLIEKARMSLVTLATVRENRQNLAGGYQEVAYENGTMSLMLSQLNIQERELLQQFIGVSREETLHFRLSYLPLHQDTNLYPVAWVSKQQGILNKSSVDAIPVSIQIKTQSLPENLSSLSKPKKGFQGLVYRLPATSECSVYIGNELIYSGQHIINQFGNLMCLPKQIKRAVFYPATGGIKNCR